jgi:DNA-directed RNA polymerase specialized sigma24 family protein
MPVMVHLTDSFAAEIQSFLELIDRGPLRFHRRVQRRSLLTRLRHQTVAGDRDWQDVVVATRGRWASDYRVAIPGRPAVRIDDDGIWVEAWLLAGEGLPGRDPTDPATMSAALARVPVVPREVFILHRRDGLKLEAIEARLALPPGGARSALAEALLLLDEILASNRTDRG